MLPILCQRVRHNHICIGIKILVPSMVRVLIKSSYKNIHAFPKFKYNNDINICNSIYDIQNLTNKEKACQLLIITEGYCFCFYFRTCNLRTLISLELQETATTVPLGRTAHLEIQYKSSHTILYLISKFLSFTKILSHVHHNS